MRSEREGMSSSTLAVSVPDMNSKMSRMERGRMYVLSVSEFVGESERKNLFELEFVPVGILDHG